MSPTAARSFYGYKEKCDKLAQLQEVLGLQLKPIQFQIIKNEVTSLTDKYIDRQGHKAQYQRKALGEIDQELCKKYPEIFRGEDFLKKLYYARRVVLYIDQCRRLEAENAAFSGTDAARKTEAVEKEQRKKNIGFIDLTIDTDDERNSSSGQPTRTVHTTRHLSLNKASPKKRRLESCSIPAERLKKMARVENNNPKKATGGLLKVKTEETVDLRELAEPADFLRQFLLKCRPPMDHVFHKFIGFGCTTEAHLKSLSREWSEEQRQELLRKILFGDKGPEIEMSNFGFQSNKSAIPQLVAAVGLARRTEKCERFLKYLRETMEKYLDIKATTRSQHPSLDKIADELKDAFPEIFDRGDSKRRLYFAMRTVVQMHAASRMKMGVANKRKGKGTKIIAVANTPSGDVVDLALDDSDSEMSSLTTISGGSSSPCPPVKKKKENVGNCSSVHNVKIKREPPEQRSHPFQPVPSAIDANNLNHQTVFVQKFLRTCKPSMEHVLRRFIDFGCSNKEYLQSLSTWPYEKRYKVLKKLLAGNMNSLETVREMDLVILENQFQTFSF